MHHDEPPATILLLVISTSPESSQAGLTATVRLERDE
jgi:hypothetical protein